MTVTAGTTIGLRPISTGILPLYIDDSSANILVLAGAAGRTSEVVGYDLTVAGASDLTWKSGTTAIGGPLALTAAGFVNWPLPIGRPVVDFTSPRAVCADAADLNLANSGSVRVSGTIWVNQRAT